LSTNVAAVRIVGAGGGGAGESNYANTNAQYNANGGNGGGLSGFQVPSTGYQGRHGQGGTQVAGGGGGDNGSAIAGVPLQGIFGAGGFNPTAGVNTSAGGSGAGGGGGAGTAVAPDGLPLVRVLIPVLAAAVLVISEGCPTALLPPSDRQRMCLTQMFQAMVACSSENYAALSSSYPALQIL